jgi:TfoX/Sxy family transcriptional regulator of competence genes
VAYDQELADRIRALVVGEAGLTEKKMFGGLAFLIGGNMAVAASGQGGLMVRVDPASSDSLVAETNARLMEMRGRAMKGWLRVDAKDIKGKRELAKWVELGATYARSLPAKR